MSDKVGSQAGREALAQKILIGFALFGGLVGAGAAVLQKLEMVPSRPVLFVAALVFLAVISWLTVVYWRSIDEAAREAHKFAWFWGANGGMLVVIPLCALIGSERLVAVMGEQTPGGWTLFGMLAVLAAQVIGYGLVWAGWWLRQR